MRKSKIMACWIILLGFAGGLFCTTVFGTSFDKKEEDAFYVAVKAYEDGFYDVALTLFDRFLKTYGSSEKKIEALTYIGQCYFAQEKYLKALDQFEGLLKSKEASNVKDKILYWLGEVHAKGKDYAQAEEYDKQLIENYKNSFYVLPATKSLARAYFNEGKYQEALKTYRLILSKASDAPEVEEAFFGVCEIYYRMKDYPELVKELTKFIKQYSESKLLGRAYFYLGEANFYRGEFNDAIDAYQRVGDLSLGSQQAELAQIGMAWSYLKSKKYNEAERVFSKFEDDDQPLPVLLGKAVVKMELKESQAALLLFEKVIELDKNQIYVPFANFGKGEVLYNLSRFDEALVAYRVALDKLRVFSGAYAESKELRDKIYYGLAWSYLKIGDFRSAQESFQKVVTLSSDKIIKLSALCQLGDAYQDAGDYKKAIETYQSFLENYPDSAYNDYMQYQLGVSWLKMESMDSAILAFRKLLKDYPTSKLVDDANYFLGVTYFQKGDFLTAKSQLQAFANEFKDSLYRPHALFLLGEILMNLGEFKPAIEALNIAIKEYPDQEGLRQKAEYEVANAYARMGNEGEANKRLSDFISRYPDSQLSPDILFWLGQSYLEKDNLANARKYFERLIRNYPNHDLIAEAFLEIGSIYFKEANFEAALRNYKQASLSNNKGTLARAGLSMGDVYAATNDIDNAISSYQGAALSETAFSKTAYLKMARIFRQKKAFKDALNALEEASGVSGAGSNAEIQFESGEILEELGDDDKALAAYLKVYYLYPDDKARTVKALLRVARIYENGKNWKELKNILEKITEMDVPEAKYAKEKLRGLAREPVSKRRGFNQK